MSIKSRILNKDLQEELNTETVIMKEVSGMGIQEAPEVSGDDLLKIINQINVDNKKSASTMQEENKRLEEEQLEKERLRLEQLEKERLKVRFEEEQRLRALKEKEEAEEAARIAAEEEEKRNKSLFGKFKKKSKSKETIEETETMTENSVLDSDGEISEDQIDDLNLEENEEKFDLDINEENSLDVDSFVDSIMDDDLFVEEFDDFSKYQDDNIENKNETSSTIFFDSLEDEQQIASDSVDNAPEFDIYEENFEIDQEPIQEEIGISSKEDSINFSNNDSFETLNIENNKEIDSINDEEFQEPIIDSPKISSKKKQKREKEKSSGGISININFGNPFKRKELEQEEQQKAEIERLKFAAYNDEFTGLLNKKSYTERINSLKIKGNLTVIYFDVNNLKLTNDTIGHEAGDSLITEAASQIKDKFPNDGFRTGGDEFIVVTNSYKKKEIEDKIISIHAYMESLTKTNRHGIRYSVSIGCAFSGGKKTFKDLCSEAEANMYENKKIYKENLKKELGDKYIDPRASDKEILDASHGINQKKKKEEPKKTEDMTNEQYDKLLTKDQRSLKKQVQENHTPASSQSIGQIVMEIQKRHNDIGAILIASKDFNNLFILQDINNFIHIVQSMEINIDFTYLYVLYRGGPQYYGVDEYTSEITHLFEDISGALLKRQIKSPNDLQKIKGINIFKQIHTDI